MSELVDVRKMTPEQKEAFHREAEARIQAIKVVKPPENDRGEPRDVKVQLRTPQIAVLTQWVRQGGEDNLHYHTNGDTFWMVLKGRVRFYGPGDKGIGDLKEMDGICLPGGSRYWFETTGDVPLEILHITAVENAKTKDQRINVDKHKDWMTESNLQVYDDK